MREGSIVEMGTHMELLARKAFYHELVNAQVFADVEDKGILNYNVVYFFCVFF